MDDVPAKCGCLPADWRAAVRRLATCLFPPSRTIESEGDDPSSRVGMDDDAPRPPDLVWMELSSSSWL